MMTFLNSSIGRKTVMALTGLFLCIFLIEHLYTNLLLYRGDGGVAFNEASHDMVHSIIVRTIEIVLFLSIVIHVIQAVNLTRLNAKARPVNYAVYKVNETSSWFSRNMGLTGSLILFFIVVHLYNFFGPYRVTGTVGGEGAQTIAFLVKAAFENVYYVILYTVSVIFLGFHLNHGFQSAFNTLGLNNKKYARIWKAVGTGFALLITIGFGSFPILFYFGIVGNDIIR